MQTKLIQIGNSYGVRLPKTYIKQLGLDQGTIEISIKKEGILISPVLDIPALEDWDRLFIEAKKAGFDPKADAETFSEWDSTISDGIE
jgi:antitoxin component of MazEF toxin-antitoxin module